VRPGVRKSFVKNEIFLGIGSSVAYYDWMRLHRKPNAPRLGQRFRPQREGFEERGWSHSTSPDEEGYRLGVIRQDDGLSRDGLQGACLRVVRGFFCFDRSSRLVTDSGDNGFRAE
jgi:hypothetical protein